MVLRHKWNENNFIFRCKKGGTLKVVTTFVESALRAQTVNIAGTEIRLIKCRNKKTGVDNIFATNLPVKEFKNHEIQLLYFRRWESETSNRDLTCTLKMEQFHSTDLNCNLQEIYMTLWLMAYVKIEVANQNDQNNFLQTKYRKPNYKEILIFIVSNAPQVILKRIDFINEKLKSVIKRSSESREHMRRSYPREIKSSRARTFINSSTVPRRKGKIPLTI